MGQNAPIREVRQKVVKIENDTLKFEGERLKTFLLRYERAAEACGASDWDMVMQINRFVIGEDLKEELETLEGYEERDWDLLKESMTEVWGDYYTQIKYTVQDLRDLAEGIAKKGGLKDIHDYREFVSKFMMIVKYLVTNEHITSQQDVVYLFLAAFSKESQKNIKRCGGQNCSQLSRSTFKIKTPVPRCSRLKITFSSPLSSLLLLHPISHFQSTSLKSFPLSPFSFTYPYISWS